MGKGALSNIFLIVGSGCMPPVSSSPDGTGNSVERAEARVVRIMSERSPGVMTKFPSFSRWRKLLTFIAAMRISLMSRLVLWVPPMWVACSCWVTCWMVGRFMFVISGRQ